MRLSSRVDALDVLGSVVAFWRFLFDRGYRRRTWAAFRTAELMDRLLMILYAALATLSGLVALAIVLWIAFTI
jgi:hypothetical protein